MQHVLEHESNFEHQPYAQMRAIESSIWPTARARNISEPPVSSTPISSHNSLSIGRVIANKYRIEAQLGVGATGEVYRAFHTTLHKIIAVKILRFNRQQDPLLVARFRREALAAAKLEHPNSLHIFDFGQEPDGVFYIAMEYIHGRTLLDIVETEGPLHVHRIVHLMSQILSALAEAHEHGIIHRDLKPENIMVLEHTNNDGVLLEHIKVCDFGVVKVDPCEWDESTHPTSLTAIGAMIGTPAYMSPEQCRGETLDARSDLYSMGVILYQMLTGQVPFSTRNAFEAVLKHNIHMPIAPSFFTANVHPILEAVCLRALAKFPEERYDSARIMRAEIRSLLGSEEQMRLSLVNRLKISAQTRNMHSELRIKRQLSTQPGISNTTLDYEIPIALMDDEITCLSINRTGKPDSISTGLDATQPFSVLPTQPPISEPRQPIETPSKRALHHSMPWSLVALLFAIALSILNVYLLLRR